MPGVVGWCGPLITNSLPSPWDWPKVTAQVGAIMGHAPHPSHPREYVMGKDSREIPPTTTLSHTTGARHQSQSRAVPPPHPITTHDAGQGSEKGRGGSLVEGRRQPIGSLTLPLRCADFGNKIVETHWRDCWSYSTLIPTSRFAITPNNVSLSVGCARRHRGMNKQEVPSSESKASSTWVM